DRPRRRRRLVARPPARLRRRVPRSGRARFRLPPGGLMKPAERVLGKLTARRGELVLGWLAAAALVASAILSLVVAPPDAEQGDVQRLMYVHVPAAWLAYLSFGVVFVCSIA